jgi:hypothetical protein
VAAEEAAQYDGGQDHDGHHRYEAEPGRRGAGGRQGGPGGLRGATGHGRRLARQVGEQLGQVPGGAGLQSPAHPFLVLVGGEPPGLEVPAQFGDGPVAVGVGYPQPAGL